MTSGKASTPVPINAELLGPWALVPPVRIVPVAAGTNNRSFRVTCADGRFILKVWLDTDRPDRGRFEHALLAALAASGLPFAVPAPVPTASGEFVARVGAGAGSLRLTLFPLIPGRPARRGDPDDARRCGEALATLDLALASVAIDSAISLPETFGDLDMVHPAILDPEAFMRRALEGTPADRVAAIAVRVVKHGRELTAGWPAQVIHADYYPANVLMDGGRMTGILDFEFAGRGYRAMDLAIGLAAFSTRDLTEGWSWPVFEALAAGYLHRLPLDRAELEAIPMLMLVREVTSLLHWLGRYAGGLTDRGDIEDRARRLLDLDAWLAANGEAIVARLASASAS